MSAFTNDAGYLTQHQDITGKADKSDTYTKTEVNNLVSNTPETDVIVVDVPSESDIATYLTNNVPAESRANNLFRVPGPGNTSFSEWAWDGSKFIMLSTKNYGIDDVPNQNSDNTVKSSTVYDLEEEIAIIGGGNVDIERAKVLQAIINTSTLKWVNAGSFYTCILLNVEHLTGKTIRVETQYSTFLGALRSGVSYGDDADFAGSRKLYGNNVITLPEETKYLYVMKSRQSGSTAQDVGISAVFDMDGYYQKLRMKMASDGRIDINSLVNCGFAMNASDGRRTYICEYNYNAVILPVMDYQGGTCRIERNSANGIVWTFIKSLPAYFGESVDYCDGEIYHEENYEIRDISIPEDANYLFVYRNSPDFNVFPKSLSFFRHGIVKPVSDKIRLSKPGTLGVYGEVISNAYQSMAVYGDYAVFIYGYSSQQDYINATLYDIKTLTRICSIQLPYDGTTLGNCHCNASMFGRYFYGGNTDLPLLYVNQWEGHKGVLVYNIVLNNDKSSATAQLLQCIEPNTALATSQRFGESYGDFVIDYDNAKLVHLGYKSSVSGLLNTISYFSLPDVTDGIDITIAGEFTIKKVTLTLDSIIDWFDIDPIRGFQDKTFIDGQLFTCYGFSSEERSQSAEELPPLSLAVIDVYNRTDRRIEIEEKNGLKECESIDIYDEKLLLLGYHNDSSFDKNVYVVNL